MRSWYSVGFAVASLAIALGCVADGPFKRVENEINDLKVEIFRQRRELENLAAKAEQAEITANSERDKNNKFRADTQETLRQIREFTQSMSNRMDSGGSVRSNTQTARQPTRQPSTTDTPAAVEMQPDDQQLAMAEKDFNAGNFSGSVDAADNLIKYFPDSTHVPEALYLKGRALYALKSYAKAQEAFQKLCSDFPYSDRFRVARLNIGRCQMEQGNKLAAVGTFEDIARRWPSSPEARSANELLQELKASR